MGTRLGIATTVVTDWALAHLHVTIPLRRAKVARIDVGPAEDVMGDPADSEASLQAQIIAERARTLDQIKRLYAVVMGFAVTSCVQRAYSSLPPLSMASLDVVGVLFAQGIAFVSLIVLFYLGAERMLDIKYLQPTSPLPRRRELLFDLFQLGATAVMFVVLAHSLPDGKPRLDAILAGQDEFTLNLIILYVLDSVILVIQLMALVAGLARRSRSVGDARNANAIWIVQNLVCLGVLVWSRSRFGAAWIVTPAFRINELALILAVLHATRFLVDFLTGYRFYYPQARLEAAGGA
jgi:hypothetical protein